MSEKWGRGRKSLEIREVKEMEWRERESPWPRVDLRKESKKQSVTQVFPFLSLSLDSFSFLDFVYIFLWLWTGNCLLLFSSTFLFSSNYFTPSNWNRFSHGVMISYFCTQVFDFWVVCDIGSDAVISPLPLLVSSFSSPSLFPLLCLSLCGVLFMMAWMREGRRVGKEARHDTKMKGSCRSVGSQTDRYMCNLVDGRKKKSTREKKKKNGERDRERTRELRSEHASSRLGGCSSVNHSKLHFLKVLPISLGEKFSLSLSLREKFSLSFSNDQFVLPAPVVAIFSNRPKCLSGTCFLWS